MLKNLKQTAALLALICATTAFTCSQNGVNGFVPKNDLYIPDYGKSLIDGGLNQAEFNAAIDKIEVIYKPIVAKAGGKLTITRDWTDGEVNAYASQNGNSWELYFTGGLARYKTMTKDGMSLVVCHELGHQIGGAPKKGERWASNEGQADYFATLKCLRRAFLKDNNIKTVQEMKIPKALTDACTDSNKNNKEEAAICVRMGMAGKSVADLFSALDEEPKVKFETPDTSVVGETDDEHPVSQCRLDTYFQGALCEVKYTVDVSQKDEVKGTCHPSLGHTIGTRPLCWFKPTDKQ